MVGYDLKAASKFGVKVPVRLDMLKMAAISGPTGSGKSTGISYFLYKMRHLPVELFVGDAKSSGSFKGFCKDENYSEGEDVYDLVRRFYGSFRNAPEGGYPDGHRLLILDELNSLVAHFAMTKEKDGKDLKKDMLMRMISTILAMGRSKKHICWICTQRVSSSNLFTGGTGSVGSMDNLIVRCAFGVLHTEARKSLFGGIHFDGEDDLPYGIGRALIMSDEESLRAIALPKVSIKRLRELYNEK